jgi:hypothetical protein
LGAGFLLGLFFVAGLLGGFLVRFLLGARERVEVGDFGFFLQLGFAPFEEFHLGAAHGLLESEDEVADFEQHRHLDFGGTAVPAGHQAGEADGQMGEEIVGQGVGDVVAAAGFHRVV